MTTDEKLKQARDLIKEAKEEMLAIHLRDEIAYGLISSMCAAAEQMMHNIWFYRNALMKRPER
jgi:hypothetical protein